MLPPSPPTLPDLSTGKIGDRVPALPAGDLLVWPLPDADSTEGRTRWLDHTDPAFCDVMTSTNINVYPALSTTMFSFQWLHTEKLCNGPIWQLPTPNQSEHSIRFDPTSERFLTLLVVSHLTVRSLWRGSQPGLKRGSSNNWKQSVWRSAISVVYQTHQTFSHILAAQDAVQIGRTWNRGCCCLPDFLQSFDVFFSPRPQL